MSLPSLAPPRNSKCFLQTQSKWVRFPRMFLLFVCKGDPLWRGGGCSGPQGRSVQPPPILRWAAAIRPYPAILSPPAERYQRTKTNRVGNICIDCPPPIIPCDVAALTRHAPSAPAVKLNAHELRTKSKTDLSAQV